MNHPEVLMRRLRTTLVSGTKAPYSTWTFLIIPAALAAEWGPGQKAVRGTISGAPFRGTASRGEGELRVPIPKDLRERAGLATGDTVDVAIGLDPDPRPVELPHELRTVFSGHPEVARLFEQLPPSLRRAWAAYVEEAKRPETRIRRARMAPAGIRAREFPR
jgi:bifunctional DNA-binding transcriptional regulator/antitoxin component of YhaV-PrlF toxin-antitoxin module